MNYPESIAKAIEALTKLPGVGSKTAERYALSLLDLKPEEFETFLNDLNALGQTKKCHICGNYSSSDTCSICQDENRNHQTLCIVSSCKDVIALENANVFKGVYHVLNGVISSSKGIYPNDIGIDKLLERIKTENIKEAIVATPLTMDGEMTALYIDKKLKGENVLVTRIARGMPMGGQIDYADSTTLQQSFAGRKKVEDI